MACKYFFQPSDKNFLLPLVVFNGHQNEMILRKSYDLDHRRIIVFTVRRFIEKALAFKYSNLFISGFEGIEL